MEDRLLDVKELLESIRHSDKAIETLKLQREQIFTRLTSTSAPIKDVDVQTSGACDKTFESVPEIVDITQQIEDKIRKVIIL